MSEAAAAGSYQRLLQSDPLLCAESHAALLRAHVEHQIMFQDRMLCSVLRPRLLGEAQGEAISTVSNAISDIFERAGEVLLQSDEAMDLLQPTDLERELWAVEPGYAGFTLTSRLDSFTVGDQVRFVEYNAESPAGIAYTDCLTEIFQNLPAMIRWEGRTQLERFEGRRQLYETLLWAYREWGGTDSPSIAVIDWDHVVTKRDFEMCVDYFRQRGLRVAICDPRKLEYRGGRVWLGDEHISLVYRRVLLHELLDKADEAKAVLQAYRDGAVCMVNSPRSKMLHKKAVFALISERGINLNLTSEEEELLDATIPWTRLLSARSDRITGENLYDLVMKKQDQVALKPVDDYGGRGVVLGWECTREEWERALEHARDGQFVVQERIEVPRAHFPTWNGDHLEVQPFLLDTDPLLFRGKVGSVLTRISASALLNVSAGAGSTTPTFIVKGA